MRLAVVACMLGLAAAACGGDDQRLTIGYAPPTLAAPALQRNVDRLRERASAEGFQLLVADAKGDPVSQVQQLMGWIKRGQVQAIWTIPVSAEALGQVLREAQKRGVAVNAVGTPSDFGYPGPAPGVSFSGVDFA